MANHRPILKLERVVYSILIGITVALVSTWINDTTHESLLKRGDFPAFYAAAKIVASKKFESLYDSELQRSIENEFWPSLAGEYYHFAYPQYVAGLLAPLAYLPPLIAKLLFTTLMLLCLILVSNKLSDIISSTPIVVFALLFAFSPNFVGVLAAQNSALSMLCYVFVLHAVYSSKDNDKSVGLALGFWAFKPHYFLIAAVFFLLARKYKTILWSLIPLSVYFIIGVYIGGIYWLNDWLTAVMEFGKLDNLANADRMVSLVGVAKAISVELNPDGGLVIVLRLATVIIACILAGMTAWRFAKYADDRQEYFRAICMLGPLVVLLSPHTLFYDSAICLIAIAAFLSKPLRDYSRHILLIYLLIAFLGLIRQYLIFDPLVFLIMASFLLVLKSASVVSVGPD